MQNTDLQNIAMNSEHQGTSSCMEGFDYLYFFVSLAQEKNIFTSFNFFI